VCFYRRFRGSGCLHLPEVSEITHKITWCHNLHRPENWECQDLLSPKAFRWPRIRNG
jgi:hypothetical protein